MASPFSAAAGTGDHNAYPGNTEVNGIDTNVTDPGFVDAANEDFRLDPVTVPADYVTFMSAGSRPAPAANAATALPES